MSRARGHRRRHQPRLLVADTMALASSRAQRLSATDVASQMAIVNRAVDEFARGHNCAFNWSSLADTANMAETLAGMGLGAGADAERVINDAQRTLADVHHRHTARGSWTLWADEIQALQFLASLHKVQLTHTSYGELDAALTRARQRLEQARAGNASANAVVVVGQMGQQEVAA